MDSREILKNLTFIYQGLIGLLIGFIGYFIKSVQDRYSDHNKSITDLLELETKGVTLKGSLQKRLKSTALENYDIWKNELSPPSGNRKVNPEFLSNLKEGEKKRIQIPLDMGIEQSRCPVTNRFQILYFDTFSFAPDKFELQPAEVVALIRERLNQLKSIYPNSDKLIKKYLKLSLPDRIHLWVKIPNIKITKLADSNDLLGLLAKELNGWFTNWTLTAELYYSSDIVVSSKSIQYHESELNSGLLQDEAMQRFVARNYALYRSLARDFFKNNKILGQLTLPKLPLPDELLQKKVNQINGLINGEWKVISIFGRPGSGKTEMVDLFLKQCDKTLFYIICKHPAAIALLEDLNNYHDKKTFLKAFAGVSADILPAEFNVDDLSRMAFTDAFGAELAENEKQITLVIDDLDSLLTLKNNIEKQVNKFSSWNISFILIGRAEIKGAKFVNYIQLEPWDQEQALQILKHWNSSTDWMDDNINHLLAKNKDILSSYLLRIIATRKKIDNTIDEMLTDELSDILKPFEKLVNRSIISPEQQLANVKSKLENNIPVDDILNSLNIKENESVTKIFSSLAWHTKFNMNLDLDNAGRINSGGLINYTTIQPYINLTEQESQQFLRDCVNAKIMIGNEKYAYWQDSLVSDGCMALELKKQISDLSKISIIPRQLSKLTETNSLDFFKFTLDLGTIAQLFLLLNNGQEIDVQTLKRILSKDIILRVSEDTDFFDMVSDSLYQYCENRVTQENRIAIYELLADFYPFSKFLKDKFSDAIRLNKSVQLPLCILSFVNTHEEFLRKYKQTVDKNCLLYALCTCWADDQEGVILQLIFGSFNFEEYTFSVKANWENWCSRISIAQAIYYLRIIADWLIHVRPMDSKPALVIVLLECLFDNLKKTINIQADGARDARLLLSQDLRNNIQSIYQLSLQGLSLEDYKKLIQLYIYWCAYFTNTDLANSFGYSWLNGEDILLNVVPQLPNSEHSIPAIISKFAGGKGQFRLPHSSELSKASFEGPELVSDFFPAGYNYTTPIAGALYRVWDGKVLSEIDHDIIVGNSRLFNWRAVFLIK